MKDRAIRCPVASPWRRKALSSCQGHSGQPSMGSVNLPTAARASGNARITACGSGGACHPVPFGECLRPEETMVGGPEQMAADPEEVLCDAVHRREPLELPGGLEAAHLPFALSCRFVRDLGSVVGVRVRELDDRGHHRAAGGSIAGQLVGDQPSRGTALPLQQRAEEADGPTRTWTSSPHCHRSGGPVDWDPRLQRT